MNTNKTILIEQTSKKWKALSVKGLLLTVIGLIIACCFFEDPHSHDYRSWLLWLAAPGALIMLYSSARAWWDNG